MKILLERFPYRYVECGTLEINGMPDFRIQKADHYTKRYSDMYLLDNQMQLLTAMEDFEYTKWVLTPIEFLAMLKTQKSHITNIFGRRL